MSFNTKFNTLKKLLIDKDFRFCYLADRGKKGHVPAEKFLQIRYRSSFGKELNLKEPQLYTEKLQWLKLYDQRPEYTKMVDKYAAKQYVAERIGEQYIVPLLGVWENAAEIDFTILPKQFVLKTTHDSGTYIICKDKHSFNTRAAKRKMAHCLKRSYYNHNREWPYKNVKPRIIAETYLEDAFSKDLKDYKFFTFGGVPKVLYIAQGRGTTDQTVADFFDMEFNHLPFAIDHNMADVLPSKPKCFEEMKTLAAVLSKGTPQLRVDFYEVNGRVYFGEMTFFHCSGLERFHPDKWDKIFGDWVTLPPITTEKYYDEKNN